MGFNFDIKKHARVVAAVTNCNDEEEAIAAGNTVVCVAVEHVGDVVTDSIVAPVGGTTDVTIGVATAVVVPTDVLWSLTGPPAADVARTPAAAAQLSVAQAQAPNSTQRKPNFAAAAAGIPDAAHASTQTQSTINIVVALTASATAVAITTKTATVTAATSTLSSHKHEDGANDDWYLAPLDPMALGNVAASRGCGHHVAHCGLQVFNLLLSDSKGEDEINTSEIDDCDEF
jgi:hypothetical protein